jgi:hypothetical protein
VIRNHRNPRRIRRRRTATTTAQRRKLNLMRELKKLFLGVGYKNLNLKQMNKI